MLAFSKASVSIEESRGFEWYVLTAFLLMTFLIKSIFSCILRLLTCSIFVLFAVLKLCKKEKKNTDKTVSIHAGLLYLDLKRGCCAFLRRLHTVPLVPPLAVLNL